MTLWRRYAVAGAAVAGVAGLVALGFLRPGPPAEPPPPYSFSDGRVALRPDSRLLERLEIVPVGGARDETRPFRAVGQVIALSNASESLTGERIGWVELDGALSASAGLKLDGGEPAGTAYGLASVAPGDAKALARGQAVEITRYGLLRGGVAGTIVKLVPSPDNESVTVVFRFLRAQDWFPGTNCEVGFPALRGHPVTIPTTAPVHEGTREYVWKQVAPEEFAAQSVSVVDATPGTVAVLGLRPGDRIVGRGAILLKPLLRRALSGGGS